MKKPTLAELIESAEKNMKPDDWYRQGLILKMFHGMSKTTLVEYCKEMEAIDEFKDDERLIHIVPERNDIGIGGCWNVDVHHTKRGKVAVQLDSDDEHNEENTPYFKGRNI